MTRTYAKLALLIAGVAIAAGLHATPPNVLNSDLDTCECYQDEAYPSVCPLSTPQLDELCSDLSGYQYNETLTEQFCSQSCLEALTTCYQQYPGNCSTDVLDYYKSSFCSRNQNGMYCVSGGFNGLKQFAALTSATNCSTLSYICLPQPCSMDCSNVLSTAQSVLGCCASSLFNHNQSPFASSSIGNPGTYASCGITLGEECPAYVEPSSTAPPSSTPSPPSSAPSPSVENGGASIFKFTAITIALFVASVLCSI